MGDIIITGDRHMVGEEEAVREKLSDLKCQVLDLHQVLSCLKDCSYLSNLLQEIYEIREGLTQLEKGLLQRHLKCCISPNIKVPGAVLIRDGSLRKVRCLLPLAPHAPELERLALGTRHRAALGISQVSDALVIVVSEEKGWISMALGGRLYPNLGTFALLKKLENEVDADSM